MDYVIGVIWYAVGLYSFVWWWTQENDFTSNDIFLMLWVGLLGPGTWLMGWGIHGIKNGRSKTVFIKRKNK